jgi:hypothetical protein
MKLGNIFLLPVVICKIIGNTIWASFKLWNPRLFKLVSFRNIWILVFAFVFFVFYYEMTTMTLTLESTEAKNPLQPPPNLVHLDFEVIGKQYAQGT